MKAVVQSTCSSVRMGKCTQPLAHIQNGNEENKQIWQSKNRGRMTRATEEERASEVRCRNLYICTSVRRQTGLSVCLLRVSKAEAEALVAQAVCTAQRDICCLTRPIEPYPEKSSTMRTCHALSLCLSSVSPYCYPWNTRKHAFSFQHRAGSTSLTTSGVRYFTHPRRRSTASGHSSSCRPWERRRGREGRGARGVVLRGIDKMGYVGRKGVALFT